MQQQVIYFLKKENGEIYAFGNNEYGQLGNGKKTNLFTPTIIDNLKNKTIISCGTYHTFARSSIIY